MSRLRDDAARFQTEGEELAGALGDFQQRAGAYCELYRHSNGNFVFPLIAAHGALWGAGYMRRGMFASQIAAKALGYGTAEAERKLGQVGDFTDALKDINRQVLIKTYTAYQLTRTYAADPALAEVVPEKLIAPLALTIVEWFSARYAAMT